MFAHLHTQSYEKEREEGGNEGREIVEFLKREKSSVIFG